MSQARRSRVRAAQRHRRAAAREISLACWPPDGGRVEPTGLERAANSLADGGWTFDIAAARDHALGLVALAEEQEEFEAWTRERGLGPENRELGAFAGRVEWRYTHSMWERLAAEGQGWDWMGGKVYFRDWAVSFPMVRGLDYGGWPGNLAREWASVMVKCDACIDGVAMVLRNRVYHGPDHYTADTHLVRCPVCRDERSRYTRAPMGRSLARLGQRILDMLDGDCWWAPSAERQPSECQHPCCVDGVHDQNYTQDASDGWADAFGIPREPVGPPSGPPCPDCIATGHNLRGYLPDIEWSPAVRRRVIDGERARHRNDQRRAEPTDLVREVLHGAAGQAWVRAPTRVCPRGEHRRNPSSPDGWRGLTLDQRINAKYWNSTDNPGKPVAPRWYLGELEHRRNQRRRSAPQAPDLRGHVAQDREPDRHR